jgi:hypothetical protein
MANMALEKLQEIMDILDRAAVEPDVKPPLKEFVMLEFLSTGELGFGLKVSTCINLWMSRGYVPLGGQFHVVDTLYFPLVLKG